MKMSEANPAKVYIAKFFFLGLSVVQWFVAVVLLVRFQFSNRNFFISLIFFTLGLLFFTLFIMVSSRIKRVAVGKKKIVVIQGDRNIRFDWPEVKSLRLIPFFNLYRLKIKGKKNPIYFFPSKNIDPAFGLLAKDTSRMGEIVEKRKKDLRLK